MSETHKDQEFVEYVVKELVDNPDKVVITRTVDDRGVLLELSVDPSDMGKIIGKAGATAKSIRTLLRVLGAKSDARFNLKIVEPGGRVVAEEGDTKEAEEKASDGSEEDQGDKEVEDIKAKAKEGLEDLDDLEV